MFESWVSDLLAGSLGHFINVQRDKLKVSLWNGVVIENASIREDALDYLDLPFKIHYGCIGRLQLQVPWRALSTSPIVVELSNVELVMVPREESEWCGDAASQRARAVKQAQLAAAELEMLSARVAAEGVGDGTNLKWLFMSQLWGSLLRRMQLTVKDVRVSFKYPRLGSSPGFIFGVTVGSVESLMEHGAVNQAPLRDVTVSGEIEKAVSLAKVTAFWKTEDVPGEVRDCDYLLDPVDGCFSITFQTGPQGSQRGAQFVVDGKVKGVSLRASHQQLVQMACFAECLAVWEKRRAYGKFRPEGWQRSQMGESGDPPLVPWRQIWQYAIKSVLQDLRTLQPGFSFARLRLWQQWRRRYVTLYQRQMEVTRKEGVGGAYANGFGELQELETELPVSVVMLFRSIAEEALEKRAEGTTDASPTSISKGRGWLRWGMSSIWGFMGYTSSTPGSHSIPNPPSEAEISELYDALGFQPTLSSDRKLPGSQLLVSFDAEVPHIDFKLRTRHDEEKVSSTLVGVSLEGCSSKVKLNEDGWECTAMAANGSATDWYSVKGVGQSIIERQGAMGGEGGEFIHILFNSADRNSKKEKEPLLQVNFNPMKISLGLKLLSRMKALQKDFPTSTISDWVARCISLLPTRRARMLAKAQHLAYSQSKLKTEMTMHKTTVNVLSSPDCVESACLSFNLELLQLAHKPEKDVWDYVRVLREIEQEHPFDGSRGIHVLNGGAENVLFDDLDRRLLYQQWQVTIHGLSMGLSGSVSGKSAAAVIIMEKASSTGNLLVNRLPAERSAAAVQCNWRCSPLKVTLTGPQMIQLSAISKSLSAVLDDDDDGGGGGGGDGDGDGDGESTDARDPLEAKGLGEQEKGNENGRIQSFGSLDLDTVLPQSPFPKPGYEVSLSAPKLEMSLEDGERSPGSYYVGGALPWSVMVSTQSFNISVASQQGGRNVGVSVSHLNFQDSGNYAGKRILANSGVPRLARSLCIRDLSIVENTDRDGNMSLSGEMSGVEATAYPGEVAGYLKPSTPSGNALGKFCFQRIESSQASKFEISLFDACFGSALIMRIAAQFFDVDDSSVDEQGNPCMSSDIIPKSTNTGSNSGVVEMVGADSVKTFTLSVKVQNCHAVLPKGAQHMAAVLGLPGGHCALVLKVSDLSFHIAFLKGFTNGQQQWSNMEIGMCHILDVRLMASTGPQRCLMAPVLMVGEIKLTSSGTLFSTGKFPYQWDRKMRHISYSMEVKSPHGSMDLERLEVALCALSDATEKMRALCYKPQRVDSTGDAPVDPIPDPVVLKDQTSGKEKQQLTELCVPYKNASLEFSMSAFSIELVRHTCDQNGTPLDPIVTTLEWNGVEAQYLSEYAVESVKDAPEPASPFEGVPCTGLQPEGCVSGQEDDSAGNRGTSGVSCNEEAVGENSGASPLVPHFQQSVTASWGSLLILEGKALHESAASYYYLTPDGRILEHAKDDEVELMNGEMHDEALALSLWAPVKMGEAAESGSVSSVGSYETAGSNFSVSRKSSMNSTGDFFYSIEEELVSTAPEPRMASDANYSEMEELFSDATPTGVDHTEASSPTSGSRANRDDSITLISVSAQHASQEYSLVSSEVLESTRGKKVSLSCPNLEIHINVCPWLGTLQTVLDGCDIMKQYKGAWVKEEEHPKPETVSVSSTTSMEVSFTSVQVMLGCLVESAASTPEDVPFYPCLSLRLGSSTLVHGDRVSLSIASCNLSSCWVTCENFCTPAWSLRQDPKQLVLINDLSLDGCLKSGSVKIPTGIDVKLCVGKLKTWLSYHRSVPLLLVVAWGDKILSQVTGAHGEATTPQDDSTSARSSFLNLIQQYGGGSGGLSRWLRTFGKVECQMGSVSMLLSDDRSQTDFPLLDANIEHVHLEAKREKDSKLVVWGMELCPMLSVYNRQKMGWEAFIEPWSLKISAESRLNRGTNQWSLSHGVALQTILRCISDQPAQVTISPGMLDTVCILQELLSITSKFSFDQFPISPAIVKPQNHGSNFFTTHWLHNQTGTSIHCWTKREGVDGRESSQSTTVLSLYGTEDASGVALRAVAMSEKLRDSGFNKRQLSISEVTLATGLEGDFQGDLCHSVSLSASERSEEWLSFGGSMESGRRSGKLQCVEEMNIQDASPEYSQRMPVEIGVASSGFEYKGCPQSNSIKSSFSRHRHMRLYFRLDNQEVPCGPVTLDTVGITSHQIRISDSSHGAPDSEKRWIRAKVICAVAQKPTGGFDITVHSNAKVTNNTSVTLDIGCWEEAGQGEPVIMIVKPGKAVWLPVVTATRGNVCLRPHPESSNPWAMRSAWSQPVDLQQLLHRLKSGPAMGVHCHLKCNPVSGGLKPVWLNVGASIQPGDLFANIIVEAPVVVSNFLTVPTEVVLRSKGGRMLCLKGMINPRCRIQGHTLEGAKVDCISIQPRGYKLVQVDHLPEIDEAVVPDDHGALGVIRDSVKDEKLAEAIVKVECEGAGSVPICVTHSIQGFTARHVFELRCALWIYNCTGFPVAIREYEDIEPFVDEEAVRIPDDKVPVRWVPPFAKPLMQEEKKASGVCSPHPSTSNAPPPRHSRSMGEIGGLKDVLQTGDPLEFKMKSGWSMIQTGGQEATMKRSRASGTTWPWMEVGGPPRQGRLRLQLRASRAQAPKGTDYWSSPLSVDSFGGAAIIQVPCPINASAGHQSFPAAVHFLAVTSHPIPDAGGAWALHVMPRYILVNQTSVSLQYRQQGIHVERDLGVGASTCVQWPDARRPLRLNLRIKESGWLWSGGISLESPGDMFVKVRHRHREETMLLQVDVNMSRSGVLVAGLSHQLDGFAPYRLDNCTNEKLHVRQEGCREQEDVLRPYSSIPYAWDEPAGTHKVVLELAGHRHVGTLKLDEVGNNARVTLRPDPSSPYTNRKRKLRMLVVTEGPTRVLVIMDEDLHPSMAKGAFNLPASHEQLGWHSWSSPELGEVDSRSRAAEPQAGLEVEVHLSGVGVSFVDARKELMYAWVSEPQLYFALGKVRYTLECALSRIQVDNCNRDAVYPVLLRGPTSTIVRQQPAITVRSSIWRRRPGGVVCIERLHLSIAPFALEVEEAHLGEIAYFWDSFLKPLIHQPKKEGFVSHEPDVMVLEDGRSWSQITPKSKIYIESLIVPRTEVTLSFCPASWRLSTQDNTQQKRLGTKNVVLQKILALADVEAAQVSIRALELHHPLLSQNALITLVGRHYMRGLVHEIYKIVCSADFLGDPVRLVHHLGLGVWSLFSNPASAALEETSTTWQIPQRVLFGLLLGLRSLVSNTIYGFSNATVKLSLTARKSLVVLGLEDESHLRLARRGITRNARLALMEPLDPGLAQAIVGGLAGLLTEPIRGAEEAGLVGLVRGTMRGLVRLLVRPVATSLEMCSKMADSIQVLVSGYQGPMPLMRVPRLVDPAAPLNKYDKLDAVGSLVVAEASAGIFSNDVLLVCVEAPSRGTFITVTHRHLLKVSMKEPNSPYSFPEVEMLVPLDEVENVSVKGDTVGLLGVRVLRQKPASSPFIWWKVNCGEEVVAASIAGWVLYACRHCPRRTKRVGSAMFVNSRLIV